MKTIILCFVLVLSLACGNNKDQKASVAKTLEVELDSLFDPVFSADKPGGSILVMQGDEIKFLRSYGLADLNTKEKITEKTVFNTGSISKTFVSNGILILEQEGLLSIEDGLNKHFDDFDSDIIAEKITIKHLLSHSSGLPDLRKVSENTEFFMTAKDTANFEPLKRTAVLNFEPGEKFEYSNPAFNGLALIIEKLSKQRWQSFIKERIFKASGMTDSKITDGAYPRNGVAHAYILNDNNEYEEYDYGEFSTFAAAGNGGIWSSVLDLAKYEKALKDGSFLNKEIISNSRTIFEPLNWADSVKPYIGYSWFIGEESLLGTDDVYNTKFVYHTGSQGGFQAFYISIPEKDILYIALFNSPVKEYRQIISEGIKLILSHIPSILPSDLK
ncbi:MAG: serine hydrolase domain-containing protein [Bacteroidota bacterium]|nr:serine hydrolase domain-containing protein [Bacteroidota bacterium]